MAGSTEKKDDYTLLISLNSGGFYCPNLYEGVEDVINYFRSMEGSSRLRFVAKYHNVSLEEFDRVSELLHNSRGKEADEVRKAVEALLGR